MGKTRNNFFIHTFTLFTALITDPKRRHILLQKYFLCEIVLFLFEFDVFRLVSFRQQTIHTLQDDEIFVLRKVLRPFAAVLDFVAVINGSIVTIHNACIVAVLGIFFQEYPFRPFYGVKSSIFKSLFICFESMIVLPGLRHRFRVFCAFQ